MFVWAKELLSLAIKKKIPVQRPRIRKHWEWCENKSSPILGGSPGWPGYTQTYSLVIFPPVFWGAITPGLFANTKLGRFPANFSTLQKCLEVWQVRIQVGALLCKSRHTFSFRNLIALLFSQNFFFKAPWQLKCLILQRKGVWRHLLGSKDIYWSLL